MSLWSQFPQVERDNHAAIARLFLHIDKLLITMVPNDAIERVYWRNRSWYTVFHDEFLAFCLWRWNECCRVFEFFWKCGVNFKFTMRVFARTRFTTLTVHCIALIDAQTMKTSVRHLHIYNNPENSNKKCCNLFPTVEQIPRLPNSRRNFVNYNSLYPSLGKRPYSLQF